MDSQFEHLTFKFPNRRYKVYVEKHKNKFYQLSQINDNAYFSHQTAAFLNDLMKKEPEEIIINYEQSPKRGSKGNLNQESIKYAFNNNPRVSKNFIKMFGNKIYLINGMHTNNLGVHIENYLGEGEIQYTNIERTLIDIAVRPQYSGGVKKNIQIFKNAVGKFSLDVLIEYLKILNFTYPYHQSIGFYLSLTQPKKLDIHKLKEFGMLWDFYLENKIVNPQFSKEWRIYYPNWIKN